MTLETRKLIEHSYGLDKPLWLNFDEVEKTSKLEAVFESQFFYYLKNLSKGDLGQSFRQKRPVSELLGNRIGPTFLLIGLGETLAISIGTFFGMVAAWKRGSRTDNFIIFISLAFWSLPAFWLGMVLLIFARGHLPMSGLMTPGVINASVWEKILDMGAHLVLPTVTLAFMLLGAYMLIMRNTTLEILAEDYILTAKAKGLRPLSVLRGHVLRNASLPLATIIALDLGFALGGLIQIETIFSFPGIGSLMFNAIGQRDYPVLQGVFLLLAVVVISANFIADLAYVIIDPRIKN
jgi:peptide/nickel transport system permease protein